MKNRRFSTYTTCGYKMYCANNIKKGMKHCHVYFIYNSLDLAVALNVEKSYYHTFDASFGSHQTSVPVMETDDYIYFNHDDLFVFAWGNGKSDQRIWMEENGYVGDGRLTTRKITDFFNQLPHPQQDHMINMGWI